MNQNHENPQRVVALIKFFSKKSHYLKFKNGSTLFRPPHFYRKIEDAGRGDRNESCLGYWDRKLGDEMPTLLNNGNTIDTQDVESILIYPANEQQDSWIQSWCVIGSHNDFESSLERMLQEFGSYFVILPAKKISMYANLLSESSCSQVRYGFVKYSDNPLERSLTVKDSSFSYQKEFRFFVGECSKDEVLEKELRLEGLNKILPKANSLKISSSSGEVRYCAVGHKKVVNG